MKIATCFGIRRESASYTRDGDRRAWVQAMCMEFGDGKSKGGECKRGRGWGPAAAHMNMNVSHFIFMARNLQLASQVTTANVQREAQK